MATRLSSRVLLSATLAFIYLACSSDDGDGDACPTSDTSSAETSAQDTVPPDTSPAEVETVDPPTIIVDARFGVAADSLGDGTQYFLDALAAIGFGAPQLAESSAGASILQQVNDGELDMGIDLMVLQSTGIDSLDAALSLFGDGIPFGLQGYDFIAYLESDGTELLHALLEENGFDNVRALPIIAQTGQAAAMARGPIDAATLSDGFLMRSFGYGQRVLLEAYPDMMFLPATGGSVTNIVEGFNDGSLYAAEFVNPCIDTASIIDAVDEGTITHYYLDNWQDPATMIYVFYRADLFDDTGLDEAALRVAQQASLTASYTRLMRRQSECLADLRERGVTIANLAPEVIGALQQAASTILEQDAAANEDVASVLGSMRDFVKRNRRWLERGPINPLDRFPWPGYESDL